MVSNFETRCLFRYYELVLTSCPIVQVVVTLHHIAAPEQLHHYKPVTRPEVDPHLSRVCPTNEPVPFPVLSFRIVIGSRRCQSYLFTAVVEIPILQLKLRFRIQF